MLLTKSTGLLGPVATILGYIMDAIFNFCSLLSVPSIGLTIILFTIIIYMLMIPLTVRQQKFSKFSAKMNPELQAVQKKYKGKQDQASMVKMNEETKAIYAKYGVSPVGSCLPMLIQMPILFALYRVIWNIPAYVGGVKAAFLPLADKIMNISGSQAYLTEFAQTNRVDFEKLGYTKDAIIDVLYKFGPENWQSMASDPSFSAVSNLVLETRDKIDQMNFFLGINIADSPFAMVQAAYADNFNILAMVAAIAIPVLSGLTQWLNMKMTPTASTGNDGGTAGDMANSMKMMNNIMPLISVFFCFTLPAGMGIYWIAGAVIRSIQQLIINKHLDGMDLDALLEKNVEKQNKKREKMGLPAQKITNQAKANVKNIQSPAKPKSELSEEEKQKKIKESTEFYEKNAKAKPGSIASKARMVQQFNDKNKK